MLSSDISWSETFTLSGWFVINRPSVQVRAGRGARRLPLPGRDGGLVVDYDIAPSATVHTVQIHGSTTRI